MVGTGIHGLGDKLSLIENPQERNYLYFCLSRDFSSEIQIPFWYFPYDYSSASEWKFAFCDKGF